MGAIEGDLEVSGYECREHTRVPRQHQPLTAGQTGSSSSQALSEDLRKAEEKDVKDGEPSRPTQGKGRSGIGSNGLFEPLLS